MRLKGGSMYKKKIQVIFVLFCVLVFIGCVQSTSQKPFEKWTPKEKGIFFMGMYNDQYESYKSISKLPNLTEPQKQILRLKKKILTEVYGPIKLYIGYASMGKIPSVELEQYITEKLTSLEQLLTKE